MNTAYRVWDGQRMHCWNDEGLRLFIDGGKWMLYSARSGEMIFEIINSKNKNAALMWGTDQREQPEVNIHNDSVKLGERIYAGDIVLQEDYDPDLYRNSTIIGEVKMLDGAWCIVNVKSEECRLLFSETAINSVIGDVYRNPELLEGVK
ncbi:YopX family protein [Bacillus atrophaeus]|uniref:YopX family protein n=1 Tax=Bacillus atrophaeus TaxID=1452 RepID=UPI001C11A843|nr:YopX family protein [Bacillus atrophaeus]MBU5262066.1 YopX family protein [Bacillus atrophaeus]